MIGRSELVVSESVLSSYLYDSEFGLCLDAFELSSKFGLDEFVLIT